MFSRARVLIVCLVAFGAALCQPASLPGCGELFAAEGSGQNGIIAMSYGNLLVLIDTNAKRILLYEVNPDRGLLLKEVRPLDKALNALPGVFKQPLTYNDEMTKLNKPEGVK